MLKKIRLVACGLRYHEIELYFIKYYDQVFPASHCFTLLDGG